MRERVAIGFGFTPDWPRKWREIFKPITKHSERKTKANTNYFRQSSENCLISSNNYCTHTDRYMSFYFLRYNEAIHGLFEKKGANAKSQKRENKNR